MLDGFNYIFAHISPSDWLTNPVSMGLCIPEACKVEDLNGLKDYIIPAVNSMMPLIFDGVQGLGL